MAKTTKKVTTAGLRSDGSGDTAFGIFQQLLHNPEQVFQLIDMFPFPVEVFAPDGILVFSNRAFFKYK